jgi:plasmid stabilization system protein ParE
MINGYRILWTENALQELSTTLEYLEKNWTTKELNKFAQKLDSTLELISKIPFAFHVSKKVKELDAL